MEFADIPEETWERIKQMLETKEFDKNALLSELLQAIAAGGVIEVTPKENRSTLTLLNEHKEGVAKED